MKSSLPSTCPYCKIKFTVSSLVTKDVKIFEDIFDNITLIFMGEKVSVQTLMCANVACKKESLWLTYCRKRVRIVPDSSAKPWPNYIPKEIREDYEEACQILKYSPNASATLARRCLQSAIRDFYRTNGKSLYNEIVTVKKEIPENEYKAIDVIRTVGNLVAHKEKDAATVWDIEPKHAELLIQILDEIVVQWYVDRHVKAEREEKVEEMFKLTSKYKDNNATAS